MVSTNFTQNQSFPSYLSHPVIECANTSNSWHIACQQCFLTGVKYADPLGVYHDLQPVFHAMTFILSSIGLLGNFLIVLTVLTHIHNSSMSDVFLFNIAVADMLYSGVSIVGECFSMFQDPKSLQESCVSQPLTSLRVLTFTVSMVSLAALSVGRLAVSTSFLITDNIKAVVLVLLWICCLAITVPLGFCTDSIELPYSTALAFLILVLPLLVIVLVNCCIWKSAKMQVGPPDYDSRSIQTVVMVTGLVIALLVTWFPYLTISIFPQVFGAVTTCQKYERVLVTFDAVSVVVLINPAINPVLFAVFSKNFRQGLKRIFRFLCSCCFEPL